MILICGGSLIPLSLIFIYSAGVISGEYHTKGMIFSAFFILLFVVYLIRILLKFNDPSPLITISAEGIEAKVTSMSKAAGLISWKDITQIGLEKIGGDLLVTLALSNPEKYKKRIQKKLSAMVLKGSTDEVTGNLIVFLTACELECNVHQLQEDLIKYWQSAN
ncbi:hypothetical protein LVD17_12430 [Fulvivirga ulvae]|uniref:STM3941 family protein n=1 Tax=Fulvivirga ulvae TaxID=2904245 RepID=UPI001F269C0D|nr:STM3941 family protein [Fulvivirga ulvae]UII34614.1 hypothetical protein LVD17_12430 [Fulvivirga ulvae]